ncbi:MAG: flagellar biosynthetic protein FliO [Lachnospiraceae bacterium]|nr:flagellar biosynthetic protein FliO [Lachnospiraceae bacterium]
MLLSVTDSGFMNVLESIGQLLVLLLILAFVLALAYYASKWTARFQNTYSKGSNMEVIETIRLQDGKYLQIVKVADKYVVIGLGKESISYICELSPDSVERFDATTAQNVSGMSFSKVLSHFTKSDESINGKVNDGSDENKEE